MQYSDPLSNTGIKGRDLGKLRKTILHQLFLWEKQRYMNAYTDGPFPPTHT